MIRKTYEKIHSVFKRDPENNYKSFLDEYSRPEFEYLANLTWIGTEKIDGTNIRICYSSGNENVSDSLNFDGRTNKSTIPPRLLQKLNKMFTIDMFRESFQNSSKKDKDRIDEIILFGEGYGAGIQKGGGKYIEDDCSFILFDVWINNIFLRRDNVNKIADKFNIKCVPEIIRCNLSEAIEFVKNGFPSRCSIKNMIMNAEGLVLKPEIELFDRGHRRIITKVKYKDFNINK